MADLGQSLLYEPQLKQCYVEIDEAHYNPAVLPTMPNRASHRARTRCFRLKRVTMHKRT